MNDVDGLLIRGDKNPNTKGLMQSFEKHGITPKKDVKKISGMDLVLVAGPENQWVFDDIPTVAQSLASNKKVVWMSACHVPAAEQAGGHFDFIPTKTFAEKSGTFVNYEGKEQKFEKVDLFVDQAFSLTEAVSVLKGDFVQVEEASKVERVHNEFVHERGQV